MWIVGLEPTRLKHQNLNLTRLPIPPYPPIYLSINITVYSSSVKLSFDIIHLRHPVPEHLASPQYCSHIVRNSCTNLSLLITFLFSLSITALSRIMHRECDSPIRISHHIPNAYYCNTLEVTIGVRFTFGQFSASFISLPFLDSLQHFCAHSYRPGINRVEY